MHPTWLQTQFARLLVALFVVTIWALTFTLVSVAIAVQYGGLCVRISSIEAQLATKK
jgi:hypothetical protein